MQGSDQKENVHPCCYADVFNKAGKFKCDTSKILEKSYS